MSWWRQVPTFSREFKCIIYDQRRFGLSPDVPNGPGALAWVEDLRRMLDELGIERASLVGQSAGGRSVLGFAAAYPDRVEKLVMASTWGGYTDAELRSSYWGLEVAAVLASAPNLGPSRNFAPSYFERDPEGVFLYEMISRTNQSAADESAPRAVTPVPDIQRIIAARVPTLVIVGERDTVAPPAVTKAFQAKMTGSRLVTFEDCGHSAYWEMHEDFNRVVLEFLRA
jgi:pimeloyl-ACP methyl ester carboxylesterase